jgi:bifunctional non-homologous end joining protein LigD
VRYREQSQGTARPTLRPPGSVPGRVVLATPAAFVEPMLLKPVACLPKGDQGRYELKLDGYRAQAIKTEDGVRLVSRNRKDLSAQFPEITNAIEQLPLGQGVLDGEIVALDPSGKPSFQLSQNIGRPGRTRIRPVAYYAFDLLYFCRQSLLHLPLLERKALLSQVLHKPPEPLRLVGFLEGEPDRIVQEICRHQLEGVVAKLATSRYEPGKRTGSWVKFKCGFSQQFVIGGFTRGHQSRSGFGALVVGYFEHGKLRYAGKVGSGFSQLQIRELVELAHPLAIPSCPFAFIPESDGDSWSVGLTSYEMRTATWLRPQLLCQIRFTALTSSGHLRHPRFEALGIPTERV